MIRTPGKAGFQGPPSPVISTHLSGAVAVLLALASLSLCLIVGLTVLSTRASMAMGLGG